MLAECRSSTVGYAQGSELQMPSTYDGTFVALDRLFGVAPRIPAADLAKFIIFGLHKLLGCEDNDDNADVVSL